MIDTFLDLKNKPRKNSTNTGKVGEKSGNFFRGKKVGALVDIHSWITSAKLFPRFLYFQIVLRWITRRTHAADSELRASKQTNARTGCYIHGKGLFTPTDCDTDTETTGDDKSVSNLFLRVTGSKKFQWKFFGCGRSQKLHSLIEILWRQYVSNRLMWT